MFICSIASGSGGNVTLIATAKTKILIDVGITCKLLEEKLEELRIDSNKISAILLTHEHIDHIKGLNSFSKKHNIKVYASPKTWSKIASKTSVKVSNRIEIEGDFFVNELTISPFEVPHDSSCCLGFSVYEQGRKVSVVTDIGFCSKTTLSLLIGSDILFLESNYDNKMLQQGRYPICLKNRIASKHGHLCNTDCAVVVRELFLKGTKNFVLCHMSQENNTPELALQEIKNIMNEEFDQIHVEIASQFDIGTIFEIK